MSVLRAQRTSRVLQTSALHRPTGSRSGTSQHGDKNIARKDFVHEVKLDLRRAKRWETNFNTLSDPRKSPFCGVPAWVTWKRQWVQESELGWLTKMRNQKARWRVISPGHTRPPSSTFLKLLAVNTRSSCAEHRSGRR